ncbi:hypothetical protein PYW08_006563 [Mythimna loreyi]|uniref:Uncharacterized protein n=1 Tax=Mythimna loreyi TaxID=667449 RepID=A0ACC2QT56_9NEOP|nr:hypothetical protein PYW08_006563 [Mythimna loreyi]
MSFDTDISEIQSRKAIWDLQSEEYANRDLKKKQWEEIVQLFGSEELSDEEKKKLRATFGTIEPVLFEEVGPLHQTHYDAVSPLYLVESVEEILQTLAPIAEVSEDMRRLEQNLHPLLVYRTEDGQYMEMRIANWCGLPHDEDEVRPLMADLGSPAVEARPVMADGGSPAAEEAPVMADGGSQACVDEEAEERDRRMIRRLLRQLLVAVQQRTQRQEEPAHQAQRRRLRPEVLRLQEDWRRAVASGEICHHRGIGGVAGASRQRGFSGVAGASRQRGFSGIAGSFIRVSNHSLVCNDCWIWAQNAVRLEYEQHADEAASNPEEPPQSTGFGCALSYRIKFLQKSEDVEFKLFCTGLYKPRTTHGARVLKKKCAV